MIRAGLTNPLHEFLSLTVGWLGIMIDLFGKGCIKLKS